jgi:hypothetical protein
LPESQYAPDAPVEVPITSSLAAYALQFAFGINRVKLDIIDTLAKLPVLEQTGDPRLKREIDELLRRSLSTLNEMTGAGIPSATTSQTPASVSPLEVA